MVDLLNDFSLGEIISLLITFALGVKGFVTFWDWVLERLKKAFNQQTQKDKDKEYFEEKIKFNRQEISHLEKVQKELLKEQEELKGKVANLIQSDIDSIKAYITKEHHYLCYEQGWADDYTLDSLEKLFAHYKREGGNSFVEDLMEELRALPKVAPGEKGDKTK